MSGADTFKFEKEFPITVHSKRTHQTYDAILGIIIDVNGEIIGSTDWALGDEDNHGFIFIHIDKVVRILLLDEAVEMPNEDDPEEMVILKKKEP